MLIEISKDYIVLKCPVKLLHKAQRILLKLLPAVASLITLFQFYEPKFTSSAITIIGKELPLKTVFTEIETQTGYTFSCPDITLKGSEHVTLHLKNADIEDVMNACLKDQPFDYIILDKTIVITKKQNIKTRRRPLIHL